MSSQITVLKKFQQVSARTKILLFALLLIILPSGFLGYMGYKSIADRGLRLKDNYLGLARVVRDKLEENIGAFEESFLREVQAHDWGQDLPAAQRLLMMMRAQYPIIKDLFFVELPGSVIHPDILLAGPGSRPAVAAGIQAPWSTLLSTGERYEFVENNFIQAIGSYRKAMEQAPSDEARAYARMLAARCTLKMKNYAQAAEEYRMLAETDRDVRGADGTPLKIIGLSQLAEIYSLLGQGQNQTRTLLTLYEELISVLGGFDSCDFYLLAVKDGLESLSQQPGWGDEDRIQFERLQEKEVSAARTASYLERAGRAVLEEMNANSSLSGVGRKTFQDADGAPHQVAFLPLSVSDSKTPGRTLAYEIDRDFVLRDALPEIGGAEGGSGGTRVGIVSEEESLAFPDETPAPSFGLSSERLSLYFPWWELVLFDAKGKTIEQIIRRERQLYGAALLSIFILIVAGAGLTLKAAVHEAEVARLKSEFVSNVSHELKTPLALIRLFGETLELGDIQDKKQRQKFSRIITRETQRLSRLVENVLDFSRIDAGRKDYHFEETDITEVVSDTLEAFRYTLKDRDFEFAASIPDRPILTRIDKNAVSQALLNLLSNAEKFSKENKYIGVRLTEGDGEVWISVEDRGPGISASSLKHIFDKFDRGAGELAREVQGSGLGLTIVKHIVDSHGGRIDVESEVGEGSRFILKLPVRKDMK